MELYDGDLLAVLVCIATATPPNQLLPCAPMHMAPVHMVHSHRLMPLNPPGQITCTLLSTPACIYLH